MEHYQFALLDMPSTAASQVQPKKRQPRSKTPKWKLDLERGIEPTVQYSIEDWMQIKASLKQLLPQGLKEEIDLPSVTPADRDYHGWSESEAKDLHFHLLRESLRAIKQANGNPKTKKDVLKWITEPIVKKPMAFSFQACCELEGVNPETMLEETLNYLERVFGMFQHNQNVIILPPEEH